MDQRTEQTVILALVGLSVLCLLGGNVFMSVLFSAAGWVVWGASPERRQRLSMRDIENYANRRMDDDNSGL